MLVLDTNVLSELMKSEPHPSVIGWIADQSEEPFFTTSLSKAEVLAGIVKLPIGRRRRTLDAAARRVLKGFRDRILSFDDAATGAYAEILEARRHAGRPIKTADLIIASIASVHDATVLTRDVDGFELTGVALINPWD